MEFYQFHPTGIYRLGILITEGVRGEGGILRNDLGERFMERYAPTMKDLASRDVVARAISKEIREGRGINGKKYVYLDATHLGAEVIESKLPDIADFCRTYLGVDPVKEPMPIQPTAHYAMGGIPTDIDCRVLDAAGNVIPGLYAAGEVACVSVHGANRLGTNSLLDLVVFGRRGGMAMAEFCKTADLPPLPADPTAFDRGAVPPPLGHVQKGEPAAQLREEMQDVMQDDVGIYRTGEGMAAALEGARAAGSATRTCWWGQGEALQHGPAGGVGARQPAGPGRGDHRRRAQPHREPRRPHARGLPEPQRRRSGSSTRMVRRGDDGTLIDITYKPVVIKQFQPKERVY